MSLDFLSFRDRDVNAFHESLPEARKAGLLR